MFSSLVRVMPVNTKDLKNMRNVPKTATRYCIFFQYHSKLYLTLFIKKFL